MRPRNSNHRGRWSENPQGCPVLQDAFALAEAGRQLTQAMKKLSRDLTTCLDCPALAECPLRKMVDEQLDEIIKRITIEWGLAYILSSIDATEKPVDKESDDV
jgi:hypothetical protein